MNKLALILIITLPLFCLAPRALAADNSPPANAAPTAETAAAQPQDAAKPKDGAQSPVSQVDEAWRLIWSGQREMLKEMRETALKLSDNFSSQTQNLSSHMRPFEEEGRRLLVFANTFKGHPNELEAVYRRMGFTINELNEVLEPVTLSRAEASSLLDRVAQMSLNLPDDTDKSQFSEEMRAYINDINRARLRLTAVLTQYDSILPSLGLIKRLEEARKSISAALPGLWRDYYLQKPVSWLNPANWENMGEDIYYTWQAAFMRLPVEMPISPPELGPAVLRFCICLTFACVLSVLLKRRWFAADKSETARHIFRISIPWLVFGFAFLGSALSATGEFYRLVLVLGCFCLIIGEIFLAWDLRHLQYPDAAWRRAPFLRFLPLALCAYLVFYLPLTPPLRVLVWSLLLVAALGKKPASTRMEPFQLESGTLECHSIALWICLFLAVSGLHIYSMCLYLAYAAGAIALEICVGGVAIVGRINERLPQEGARAALSRFLVALAAPFVLVLAVAGICLWVAMLPGGTYLLGEYALKGVSVGATQFNIIQLLLILTVFYLTRTVVSMGTRFLAKLPRQGVNFDTTLITPLQTALTYAAWAVFGLFVLRSLGMELSSLAMVAGGLSVGIGFGMQTIVNNFISGLILIFGRTLRVGDVVEVGGLAGRVRKISVRATMVETYDNAVIFVPNSEFMANRLINWTSFSRSVRREIVVGVAYGSDTETVVKLLIEIAKKHESVLNFPAPSVIFNDFGASSLDFKLRFWVKDYEMGAIASSDIRLAINDVFNEHGIDIAFPQLDVHIKDMPGPKTPVKSNPAHPAPRPKRPPASGKIPPRGASLKKVPSGA